MRKLFTAMRNAPKRASAVFTMVAAAALIPTALLAWGPDRETFTVDNPADYVTFNSITDNPNIGDERNFVGIREFGTNKKWTDNQQVQTGKTYTVRMFVHNNAATSLNASGEGIAKNVVANMNLPTNTAKSIQVDGAVTASNATPKKVWDQAKFTSNENFNLALVPGTLKFENNKGVFNLPQSLLTSTGAKLGYSKMDGKIPGCFKFSGYVSFQVKPQIQQTTDFTLDKKVSKHGENNWTENYQAQPGEKVDFVLQYKNTGEVQHDGVTFRDTLPEGMSYVPGSTKWGNARGSHTVTDNDGNLTDGTGINVGSYAPGSAAWVIFSAKVDAKEELPCDDTTLVNKAKVNTGGYSVSDDAKVSVDTPDCPEPEEIQVCDLKTNEVITISEDEFNPERHSKDLTDCEFVKVCDPATGDIITVPTHERDDYLPVGSKECKDAPVTPEEPKEPEMPAELPKTGPAETIVSIASLGALIASSYYYVVSRRIV